MNLKQTLPATILIVFLMVIIISSFSSQRQKKELVLIAQQIQRDAEEKLYLMGKFDPAQRADFILVPEQNAIIGADKMYLRKETLDAFIQMATVAESEGIELKIASATRNFDSQQKLWNERWSQATVV